MAKLRKLVGWLPTVGAMIFKGCVIGWLHWGKAAASGAGDLRRGHRVRLCDPAFALVVSGPGSNGLRDRRAVLSVVRRAAAGGAAVCADSAPAGLAGGGVAGSPLVCGRVLVPAQELPAVPTAKPPAATTATSTSSVGRIASVRSAAGSACCWQRSCWQCRCAGACGAAGCT